MKRERRYGTIQWDTTHPLKKPTNNAICRNMDVTRGYYTRAYYTK